MNNEKIKGETQDCDDSGSSVCYPPLTDQEMLNLFERMHIANVFDKRGGDVRILSYAEKLELIPRLIETIAVQRKTIKHAYSRVETLKDGLRAAREQLGERADKQLEGIADGLENILGG